MQEGVEREQHVSKIREQEQQQQQSHQHIISLSNVNTLENCNSKDDITTGVHSRHVKLESETNIATTGESASQMYQIPSVHVILFCLTSHCFTII